MNHEFDRLNYSSNDGIARIVLNSPADGNAIDLQMTDDIVRALEAAHGDAQVRLIVISSSGSVFCGGGNVDDMKHRRDLMAGSQAEIRQRLTEGLQRIPRAFEMLRVPVLAVIDGAAFGAGFDLALMCDVRIASASARFSESFLRLGLVSGIGGTWYLNRVVGPARAAELSLTCEVLDGRRALELGVVSAVAEEGDLPSLEMQWISKLTAYPPDATRATKVLARTADTGDLDSTMRLAAELQASALVSDEHRATLDAFLRKRQRRKAE